MIMEILTFMGGATVIALPILFAMFLAKVAMEANSGVWIFVLFAYLLIGLPTIYHTLSLVFGR